VLSGQRPGPGPRYGPGLDGLAEALGKGGAIARLVTMSAIAGVLVAGIFLPVVGGAGMVARKASDSFTGLSAHVPSTLPERSEILDAAGHPLAYIYGHAYGNPQDVVDRVPVGYNQIAPVMKQAIVAIEDSRYYQHGGFDLKGTTRAAFDDLMGRAVQGGSTIAQQYVKNIQILSAKTPAEAQAASQDNLGRKLRELRYAVAVSHQMSKEQMLSSYLNVAYFGEQAYGVEVAAQRYFGTSAAKLTLPQAALLAGLVEDPTAYDPAQHPQAAIARRNIVLARMAQLPSLTGVTQAQAAQEEKAPLNLRLNFPPGGCVSSYAPFYCDYVLSLINNDKSFRAARQQLNGEGGLRIYTSLDPRDQGSAQHAVDYELPASGPNNPSKKLDTEVMVQPGTGQIRAMAIDRGYGTCSGCTTVNYAVGPQYDGGEGFQIGSTGKIYTMVTALEQGMPFGYAQDAPYSTTVNGVTNCAGNDDGTWNVHNDESEHGGRYTLYTGTTASINTFYAGLEKKVGLCNVVHTASTMGLAFPDGTSLLDSDKQSGQQSADNVASFTLGDVNVTPLSVAAADATLPARGMSCSPMAVDRITDRDGRKLGVDSPGCHRVMSTDVADAANYILQGDLKSGGTASDDGIGRPAASKTGTADSYASAAFVGYTPGLLASVIMADPRGPGYTMQGDGSCYRGGCPGNMYGSMGPGQTWQMSFQNADLGSPFNFVPVPGNSPFLSKGDGQSVPSEPKPPKPPNQGDQGGSQNCPTFPFCPQPGGGGAGGGGGGGTGGGGHGHGGG
jgi:membrane peptidoglycan carboxypeptidase